MARLAVYWNMKKKGQAEIGVGLILLIGVLIIGAIGSYDSLNNSRFVLDPQNKIIYDVSRCSIKGLSNVTYIKGDTIEDLLEDNYRLAECSK